jgi:hypothetical protein
MGRMNASRVGLQILALSALAMTLAACGSNPEPPAKPVAAAPATAKPVVASEKDATAKMARAVGAGKPGAAVDLKYELAARPQAGKPVELTVALVPSPGVDSMDVTFGGMDGITLAGDLTANFPEVKPGESYTHTLSLLPARNGVFYVTATVNTQIGGASLGRTFSIPFVVGDAPAQQQKPTPAKDANGQAIQPMKAQEKDR